MHGCTYAQWCPTPGDPVDCSLPGSSSSGIFHARILEWAAISFCSGSFWPREWACVSWVSCIGGRILYHCPTCVLFHHILNLVITFTALCLQTTPCSFSPFAFQKESRSAINRRQWTQRPGLPACVWNNARGRRIQGAYSFVPYRLPLIVRPLLYDPPDSSWKAGHRSRGVSLLCVSSTGWRLKPPFYFLPILSP